MSPWVFAACALACLAVRFLVAGRQLDATPLLFALAPINAAAFSMRRALSWTRGAVEPTNEPKKELFSYAGAEAPRLQTREEELRARYRLGPLHRASTAHVYRENLYLLDLLDRHAGDAALRELSALPKVRALDVGSQDFRYAFALARFLGAAKREVWLTGIEIDGHHVYADLHSRRDHAEAFAGQVDDARVDYEVGDFLAHRESGVDVVFFFFPFVLEYALVRWGLPRRYFGPQRIFEHAFESLRPGGAVIIMNHTEAERQRQLELLEECGFEILRTGGAASALVDYADDVPERSLTIARRPLSMAAGA